MEGWISSIVYIYLDYSWIEFWIWRVGIWTDFWVESTLPLFGFFGLFPNLLFNYDVEGVTDLGLDTFYVTLFSSGLEMISSSFALSYLYILFTLISNLFFDGVFF